MFRFRFKFLADSYLLLFSFFLGMIGAALFFWWRYPVFPSYLFYSHGITGNKNFTEAFLIVIKQRFCMAVWDTDLFLVFQPGNGSYLFYIGKGTLGTASVFAFPSSPGDILSHGLVRSFQMVF